jgi:hypothetical protein
VRCLWVTSVVLATQEADIRSIVIQSQPISKKTLHKKRAFGVIQGVGPELKPQYHKKKKKSTEQYVARTKIFKFSIENLKLL